MPRTADQLAGSADPGFVAVVGSVARGDQRALARLYWALAPTVADSLRMTVPDPADAAAVISATFVEVWWLARFHTAAGTDVPAWVVGIATRRARERPSVRVGMGSGDHSAAEGYSSAGPTRLVQDRHYALTLSGLLNDRIPAGGPAPYQARTAAGMECPP